MWRDLKPPQSHEPASKERNTSLKAEAHLIMQRESPSTIKLLKFNPRASWRPILNAKSLASTTKQQPAGPEWDNKDTAAWSFGPSWVSQNTFIEVQLERPQKEEPLISPHNAESKGGKSHLGPIPLNQRNMEVAKPGEAWYPGCHQKFHLIRQLLIQRYLSFKAPGILLLPNRPNDGHKGSLPHKSTSRRTNCHLLSLKKQR